MQSTTVTTTVTTTVHTSPLADLNYALTPLPPQVPPLSARYFYLPAKDAKPQPQLEEMDPEILKARLARQLTGLDQMQASIFAYHLCVVLLTVGLAFNSALGARRPEGGADEQQVHHDAYTIGRARHGGRALEYGT